MEDPRGGALDGFEPQPWVRSLRGAKGSKSFLTSCFFEPDMLKICPKGARKETKIMPRGGARTRSGPAPDPASGRSDRRKLDEKLRPLPASGFNGKLPEWPLPKGTPRERSLWKKIWKYPQAAAWINEPWRWLTIGHYVRWVVKSEAADASPSTMTQVLRLADSIGLSPAGLRENGWVISASEMEGDAAPTNTPPQSPQPIRRLRAVNGDAG